MSLVEKKLESILLDLKENHGIVGVRSEFESEGTTKDEALRLKEIASKIDLGLTVKIGGCEALRDIFDTKDLEASTIIVPMIETPYAVEKFSKALKTVYSQSDLSCIKSFINVETITGFNNLSDILASDYFDDTQGIVLGRVDMAGSLGLGREDVDSDRILSIATIMSEKIQNSGKEMIIGGGISIDSLSFIKKLPYFTGFETRKIVFCKDAIHYSNITTAILKATEFELIWIKNKDILGGTPYKEDLARTKMLEQRYNMILEKCYGSKGLQSNRRESEHVISC